MSKHWHMAKEIKKQYTNETMSLDIVFLPWVNEETENIEHVMQQADIILLTHVASTLDSPLLKNMHAYMESKKIPYVLVFHDSTSDIYRYGIEDDELAMIQSYLEQGGIDNFYGLCQYMLSLQGYDGEVSPVKVLPYQGILGRQGDVYQSYGDYVKNYPRTGPVVGIFFYREDWVSGELEYPYALYDYALQMGLSPVLVFGQYSEKRDNQWRWYDCWQRLFEGKHTEILSCIITTCKFSIIGLQGASREELSDLGVPILQGFVTYTTFKSWQQRSQGLEPMDISFSLTLPEMDGILNGHIVATREYSDERGYYFKPYATGIQKLLRQANRWIRLREKEKSQVKIVLFLHNYPPKNSHIGSACGLDTPESILALLRELQHEGYRVEDIPNSSEALMDVVTKCATNDLNCLTEGAVKKAPKLSKKLYDTWFSRLDTKRQEELLAQWGTPLGDVFVENDELIIPGVAFGNVWILVQPPRGFSDDPDALYHSPDIPPTHHYEGVYQWVRTVFQADVVIHMGTHGNLEWLPGKGIALSAYCYPQLGIEDVPNIYPYWTTIVGEGIQAKRRSHATLISYLSPPMKRAGLYGEYERLEQYVEEYEHIKLQETKGESVVVAYILSLIKACHLETLCQTYSFFQNLGKEYFLEDRIVSEREWRKLAERIDEAEIRELVGKIHNYLMDLNNRHIRSGLHILGKNPSHIEEKGYVEAFLDMKGHSSDDTDDMVASYVAGLRQTTEEMKQLLRGIAGYYIPSTIGGAITNGGLDVLPMGRNFYGVDERTLPTMPAYAIGCELGDALLQEYIREEQRYPEEIGIVLWADNASRTHGQCVGEILYLLGVKPLYVGNRVSDLEVIPLDILGRPRIDVTCRISGLFRDMMPSSVSWIAKAVRLVTSLDESYTVNYVKKHVEKDRETLIEEGTPFDEAVKLSSIRVFGDAPGAYGAGVNQILEERNWSHREELANAYITWGGYGYDEQGDSISSHRQFQNRLRSIEVTVKNEDNREVGLLSTDDFNAYHGGMIAAVESVSGIRPKSFIGDTTYEKSIVVRSLEDEIQRQFRSEAMNPIFIEGMMKHGYKGAADLASYVQHSFEWDATSDMMQDWMYDAYTDEYVMNREVQRWMQRVNPWALGAICNTLLEAAQRGFWETSEDRKEALRELALSLEDDLEEYYDEP